MRDYRPDDFADAVGGDFIIAGTDPAIALTLKAITPIAHSPRDGGGFALQFLGPSAPIIPQGTLGLNHGDEEHVIFVVATASRPDGTDYQAIFN